MLNVKAPWKTKCLFIFTSCMVVDQMSKPILALVLYSPHPLLVSNFSQFFSSSIDVESKYPNPNPNPSLLSGMDPIRILLFLLDSNSDPDG